VDKQCLAYVIDGTVGSDATQFWNGKMDHERPEDYGITLDEFVEKVEAKKAGLEREEVIALRVYTTASYKSLNDPFHNAGTGGRRVVHPFPATIGFLASGIKKLRSGMSLDAMKVYLN